MFGNAIEQALQAASNYLVFYYSAHTCRNNSEKADGGGEASKHMNMLYICPLELLRESSCLPRAEEFPSDYLFAA